MKIIFDNNQTSVVIPLKEYYNMLLCKYNCQEHTEEQETKLLNKIQYLEKMYPWILDK